MLDEANQESWNQLETATSGSQTLLHSTERYGAYLANTVMDTDTPLTLVRENIGELMLDCDLKKAEMYLLLNTCPIMILFNCYLVSSTAFRV